MDKYSVNERVKAFHARHGGECYTSGGWRYYKNGAMREVEPMGLLAEPPSPATIEGEWQLETNKLIFARLKLKAAVDEFEAENERLCHWNVPNPDAAIANLERLQKLVDERKQLVEAAEERLNRTRRGRLITQFQRHEQENRERMLAFQERRRAVRI